MTTGSYVHLQRYLPLHFGRCENALLSYHCVAKLDQI